MYTNYLIVSGFLPVLLFINGVSKPVPSIIGPMVLIEDCMNSIDDDADGLIDLNDPDCICEIIQPVSLIPNPSFEEINCCPEKRSTLNCANGWVQASEPTTDLIHTCGWMGWDGHYPPTPFPHGEAIMGFANGRIIQGGAKEYNWKEYAGACLTAPLRANTTYRFEFSVGFTNEILSPNIDITFYGTTSCDNLPFGRGNADLGCPSNDPNWKILGARNVGGGGASAWVKTEITITPQEDIYAIAIGPPCEQSSVDRTTYYFFDNLILADLRSFEFQISAVNHSCDSDFTLAVPEAEGILYQWYKDGIALLGEASHLLSTNYGEGQYQVRIISNESCLLTQAYTHTVPMTADTSYISLCHTEEYRFGTKIISESGSYIEHFATADNCDSTVVLIVEVLPSIVTDVRASIFEGESYEGIAYNTFKYPGNYKVQLLSDLGCDSIINLELEYCNVYFPNVFSPNADGTHDRFIISGDRDIADVTSLDVFDRWGTLVYSGKNEFQKETQGWDGMVNGTYVQQGVYAYIATLEMKNGTLRRSVGSVLIIN